MIIFYLFVLFVLTQTLYANFINTGLGALPHVGSLPVVDRKPATIIICAKNEAANLEKNLPAILTQEYLAADGRVLYEVIVVNDGSTDDTEDVLTLLKMQYSNLKTIEASAHSTSPSPACPELVEGERAGERSPLGQELQGKKNALHQGVSRARHEWLLLTDADCMPASTQWLSLMVAPLAAGKEIVAGYGGYYHSPGLLNAFIRWETLHTWMLYSAYAVTGKPYMAVGRNLACSKQTLQRAMHDPLWNVLPSGDDDLFVRIAGTATNTAIVSEKEAYTYSPAKATWGQWIHQKQRHLSTGKYYRPGTKLALGVYGATHAAMWLAFFISLGTSYVLPAIALMATRCVVQWAMWAIAAKKINEAKLVYFFPLFDFGWMIYNFAFLPYITWKNKKNWK